MADKLAEYVRMDMPLETAHGEQRPAPPSRPGWQRHAVWAIGLLAVVTVTALAFAAYRQPELLLNLMGLRYCG
ncbi:MAG: hypothetical protein WC830_08455 [Burkholderiales bacterium]